jgi:hypothetical protein
MKAEAASAQSADHMASLHGPAAQPPHRREINVEPTDQGGTSPGLDVVL